MAYGYDGRYDKYYEFIDKERHFEIHGNELRKVDELAESSEDVTNYIVYNRYQEGDVVVQEPKSKTPTKIYAWTYYRYETIHTFTRNPKVGDFAFAFNNVEHGFCVDRITEVRTDEDGNVNTIIVRGGIFGYQCEHTIDVGEFSSAHVTQSSFLYDQSEE